MYVLYDFSLLLMVVVIGGMVENVCVGFVLKVEIA